MTICCVYNRGQSLINAEHNSQQYLKQLDQVWTVIVSFTRLMIETVRLSFCIYGVTSIHAGCLFDIVQQQLFKSHIRRINE